MFSSITISPSFISLIAFSTSGPWQLSTLITLMSASSLSFSATGSRRYSWAICPFGRPRCVIKITFALLSQRCLIVGRASVILVVSVTLKSLSRGTLKSTRSRTFLPDTSTSERVLIFMDIGFQEIEGRDVFKLSEMWELGNLTIK